MTDDHRSVSRLIAALAIGMLTMLASSLAAMLFLPIPESNRESVSLLIGSIISQSGAVIAYFFGRSDGERKKDQTISAMADTMKSGSEAAVTIQPPVTITEVKDESQSA